MDDFEFESVLTGAQTGAEWAWERIHAELAGQLRAYVRRHGASDPDDAVGEVFIQLARNIGTFEGGLAAFRGWVFKIAYHRVLDDRRTRRRKPAEPTAEVPEPITTAPDATAEAALHRDSTDRIEHLIGRLVPDQRDVLLLRIVGGLTVVEVAETIGKTVGATKALQRRGIAALKRILDDEGVSL